MSNETTEAPLAHLADDPDALRVLQELYLAAYLAGAITAMFNLPLDAFDDAAPRTKERAHYASAFGASLQDEMQSDPAVMLTIEQGLTSLLRGESPAPNTITTA